MLDAYLSSPFADLYVGIPPPNSILWVVTIALLCIVLHAITQRRPPKR